MELNQPASDFELADIDGDLHKLSDYRGRVAIVNFWSCECPHVVRTDRLLMALSATWRDSLALLSIASNRIESLADIAASARARGLPIVLHDAQHVVADLYAAQTTPEVFLVDRGGILRYRGAVDDVDFRQHTPTRFLLQEAVEALLAGKLPAVAETRSYGCAIVREAVE
jgi:thiol-disulfide isomerase/thioredoxin